MYLPVRTEGLLFSHVVFETRYCGGGVGHIRAVICMYLFKLQVSGWAEYVPLSLTRRCCRPCDCKVIWSYTLSLCGYQKSLILRARKYIAVCRTLLRGTAWRFLNCFIYHVRVFFVFLLFCHLLLAKRLSDCTFVIYEYFWYSFPSLICARVLFLFWNAGYTVNKYIFTSNEANCVSGEALSLQWPQSCY